MYIIHDTYRPNISIDAKSFGACNGFTCHLYVTGIQKVKGNA